MSKQSTLLIIILVATVIGSFFAFCFPHPVAKDALQYDTLAWNFAKGHGYTLSLSPPYLPTMVREPVYPIFLAGIYTLFGHNYVMVKIIQIILFALTALMAYLIASKIFNKKAAIASGFLVAFCPTLANFPSYLLSETLFTFLLSLTILWLIRTAYRRRIVYFLVAGILLGTLTLCKAVMFLFVLFVMAGFWILQRRDIAAKERWINYSALIFTFLLTLSPWLIRNYTQFGTFNIALRNGKTLYGRALKLDCSFEDWKRAAVFGISEYLGSKIYSEAIDSPKDYLLREDRIAGEKIRELIKAGYNETQADMLITKDAIGKIRKRPAKYLAQSFFEAIKMIAFFYLPLLNEPHIIEKFENLNNGRLILATLRGVFKCSGYLILLLAISGIFATRTKWREWFFIVVLIIYINFIYSLLFGWARYAVPLIPYYLIFTSVGFFRGHK